MLGARLYGKQDLRLEEMEIPEISDEDVLVKIKKCSDLWNRCPDVQ